MNKFIEKTSRKEDKLRCEEAKRSLNNYIDQLKFHFNLNDEEVIKVLMHIVKSKNFKSTEKKWWQFWK